MPTKSSLGARPTRSKRRFYGVQVRLIVATVSLSLHSRRAGMFRSSFIQLRATSFLSSCNCQSPKALYSVVSTGANNAADEQEAAQQWFDRFALQGVPRRSCEVSFSRSSGPGGQNVNK